IASIVAPAGDFSIAITQSCLDPGSLFGRFALLAANCAGLVTATGVAVAQLLASSQILTLRSSVRLVADIAPPLPKPRGGQKALAGGGGISSEAKFRTC